MNVQQAYEKIVDHFSEPGAELANNEAGPTSCVYRGDYDAKSPIRCAFGVLIPDELYTPDFENTTAFNLFDNHPQLTALFDDVGTRRFIVEAQRLHDDCISVGDFLYGLKRVAARHGANV